MGRRSSTKSGATGQCTWGANEKWVAATGNAYYPALTGDALNWAKSARANGRTVVLDPQPRAMVVIQPGVQGAGDDHR